jgi:hypothetical protein
VVRVALLASAGCWTATALERPLPDPIVSREIPASEALITRGCLSPRLGGYMFDRPRNKVYVTVMAGTTAGVAWTWRLRHADRADAKIVRLEHDIAVFEVARELWPRLPDYDLCP